MTSPSPLITATELASLLDQPNLKLFDVRGTWSTPARDLPECYAKGHIKGAVYLDWTTHFLEQDVPLGLASVADQQSAKASFEALGINPGDDVVIYDDNFHMFAGRIWWAMRYWGFENVRVLSGGWENWKAAGLPTTTDPTTPSRGTFEPAEKSDRRVSLNAFLTQRETACVFDGRGAEGYAGNPDDPRTGHIPGAISLPFKTLLTPDSGEFLSDAELAAAFDAKFPDWTSKPVISSCGSGYTATVLMLAMEHLGVSTPLFDGSFAQWKQDPGRAVEQS